MVSLHVDTGRRWRGGQRQCCLLCGYLTAEGHPTHLVCRPGSPLWQHGEDAACRLHPLRAVLGLDPLAGARLAHLLGQTRPEILAAHDSRALGLLALAAALAGSRAPLVYHRRVDLPISRHLLSRWKVARVALFICVSGRIAEILAAGGIDPKRIRVVHSGTKGIAPAAGARARLRAELGLSPAAILLATVGGLIPHKGHRVLIEAFARLVGARGDLYLLIAGDGPLRDPLTAQTRRLGLGERVRLLGERQDLATIFGGIDLFVHPSLTEGLGSSILDAFAAGVPVVATRTGGIPEIVAESETGWLADPGDAADLAAVIAKALDDPAGRARCAETARARQRERFTAEAMGLATLRCYRELFA